MYLFAQGKMPQLQDKAVDEEEEQAAAQAAAVAVALAESVAGSPQARSSCTTPPPRTPYASSGGTTPQNDRVRPWNQISCNPAAWIGCPLTALYLLQVNGQDMILNLLQDLLGFLDLCERIHRQRLCKYC